MTGTLTIAKLQRQQQQHRLLTKTKSKTSAPIHNKHLSIVYNQENKLDKFKHMHLMHV